MDCTPGQYQGLTSATSYACTACSQGKFATSGSVTACSGCGIGRFQDLTSAVEYNCKLCTQGRYGDAGSLHECTGKAKVFFFCNCVFAIFFFFVLR